MVIGTLALAAIAAPLAGIALARFLYVKKSGLPERLIARFERLDQRSSWKVLRVKPFEAGIARLAKTASIALGGVDRNQIDQFALAGTGAAARIASRAAIWCDAWVVDGFVSFIARAVEFAGIPVRLLQSGFVQRYMLWIVAGVIGILGGCLYAAHHAAMLAGH
jgi:NADH:ubiquinone oxidoreductase subunit 5 (subunit L)/multisubunit Na+/H+ antiporter MnhA subunit